MVRVVETGPWEMFDLSDGKWHILYDAWQTEDFELLAFTSDVQGFGPVIHVPGNLVRHRGL